MTYTDQKSHRICIKVNDYDSQIKFSKQISVNKSKFICSVYSLKTSHFIENSDIFTVAFFYESIECAEGK